TSGLVLLPALIGFYSFYGLLFTKYLKQKKIGALFVYGLITSLACGFISELYMSLTFGGVGIGKGALLFPNYEPSEIAVAIGIGVFIGLLNGIVGLVTKGFITAYADIKLKEDLNKKNYDMELALVKNQIHPHFLFNTLNNIDVLIEKDAAKASDYLKKLSDILRFMLYETKTELIPLQKELDYIGKYVELQKIRTSNPNYVRYNVEGDPGKLMIAPLLFIPFIENAFKHAENTNLENAITILLQPDKNTITFTCTNLYSQNALNPAGSGGLGNDLIRKRLELLYPGKHKLEVSNTKGTYNVKLIIQEC
ncbi:MAG TPA: histidine kinase, partial [Bacteroidia bacterium]|nr:histidine kinase [Bacteroidia bacterium]